MTDYSAMLCAVYKSPREEELYLFTRHEDALSQVPEPLQERFGEPQKIMTLRLTPAKKLARANAATVLASIQDKGYYLQLPPPRDTCMQAVDSLNEKMYR